VRLIAQGAAFKAHHDREFLVICYTFVVHPVVQIYSKEIKDDDRTRS
jgi:hypothetical protein